MPGYFITSFGAQVIVEQSCFSGIGELGNGGGPILLGRHNDGESDGAAVLAPQQVLMFDNNFVANDADGTTDYCNLVSEMQPDGLPPTCNVSVMSADSASECQSTVQDLFVFW